MQLSGSEIWWALTVGTVVLMFLGGIYILSIVHNQKRFLNSEREKVKELEARERQIKESCDKLRELSAHLQSIREEERTTISREIHDELGQMLTVIKMDLSFLQRKMITKSSEEKVSELKNDVQSIMSLIDDTIKTIRRISRELRPEILDELGIVDAIESELQAFQTRMNIKCDLSLNIDTINLDKNSSIAVYRILQEALTNIARHSQATEMAVKLWKDDNNLFLEVKDNGKGISEIEIAGKKSLGILGMRERALLLGGELKLSSSERKGTTVNLQLPISGENKSD